MSSITSDESVLIDPVRMECKVLLPNGGSSLTINIPSDRSIAPSSSTETTGVSRSALSSYKGSSASSSDHISVSSGTMTIHAALDDISVGRASRVAQLAQLYAGGRYTADAASIAKSLISGADSVKV